MKQDGSIVAIGRRLFSPQFMKFVMVGVLNTGFSYSLYCLLVYVGLNFALANFLAVATGIVFSFHTQSSLVFRSGGTRQFVRFVVGWCSIWLLNVLLIKLLIDAGLNAYWAGAAALVPTTMVSFLVQKYMVFASPSPTAAAVRAD